MRLLAPAETRQWFKRFALIALVTSAAGALAQPKLPAPPAGAPQQRPVNPASSPAAAAAAENAAPAAPPAAAAPGASTSPFFPGEKIHLFDLVPYYGNIETGDTAGICSLPGATLRIVAVQTEDTGVLVTVAPITRGSSPRGVTYPNPPCDPSKYVTPGHTYTVWSDSLSAVRYNSETLVTGILAVPFKFHFADHSFTTGSTIGGYVGYQTAFGNLFTVTPILSVGLALISTSPAQVSSTSPSSTPTTQSSPTQTSAGFSVATGLIGTVSNKGAAGLQYGLVVGLDWLGNSSHYQYEGKPWLAFEIGYNFSSSSNSSSAPANAAAK